MHAPDRVRQIADQLHQAAVVCQPCDPPSRRQPPMTGTEAQDVWRTNIQRRVDSGTPIRGWKAALTSRETQGRLGASEPILGALVEGTIFHGETGLRHAAFVQPIVEVEFALELAQPLSPGPLGPRQIAAALGAAIPAIEIADCRIQGWDVHLADAVADNALSGAVILGGPRWDLDSLDLSRSGASVSVNGKTLARGSGALVMGDPLRVACWIAKTVARFDLPLEPGHVLLTGSMTGAIPVNPGDVVAATFDDGRCAVVHFE